MTTPREWVQIGMLAHVVKERGAFVNLWGSAYDHGLSAIGAHMSASYAACYEADRREK